MGEISLIPEVLLLNILSRLAVKDVIRLRSVCKDWNFLLRSPNFSSLHLLQKRHENRFGCSSFFLLRMGKEPSQRADMILTFLSLEKTETAIVATVDRELSVKTILPSFFKEPYWSVHNIKVFCPFDGLICFGNRWNVVMYNPATRELEKLPLPSAPSILLEPFITQAYYTGLLGVWLESTMKQHYKVFRIVYWDGLCQLEIYDSITNCWRSTNLTILGRIYYKMYLLFNDVVHFYMQRKDLDDRFVIVTVDAISETFGHLELPPLKDYDNTMYLLPLRGSLALLDPDNKTHECSIWVMTEYGDEQSWTVQYWVSFIGPPSQYYDYIFQPLSFWDCVDGSIELLAKSRDGKLVSCNLDNQKITDLGLHCDPHFANILPNQVETLLSFLSLKDLQV